MALSDERLAEIRWFWEEHDDGEVSDDLAVWRYLHRSSINLLGEIDRLREWLRECDRAGGGDGSDDSLLGLVYTCGAGNDALAELPRLRARVATLEDVLREVEWSAGTWVYDDDGGRMIPACPRCLAEKPNGHFDDCELDAALRGDGE